jgi:hypothetical protein
MSIIRLKYYPGKSNTLLLPWLISLAVIFWILATSLYWVFPANSINSIGLSIKKSFLSNDDLLHLIGLQHHPLNDWAIDELINSKYDLTTVNSLQHLAEYGNEWESSAANLILFRFRDDPEIRLISLLQMLNANQNEYFFDRIYERFQPEDSDYASLLLEKYLTTREGELRLYPALIKLCKDPLVSEQLIFGSINSQDINKKRQALSVIEQIPELDPTLIGNEDIVNAAIVLANDSNIEIRAEAIKALGSHGSNIEAVKSLIYSLYNDSSQTVRLKSLQALNNNVSDSYIKEIALDFINSSDHSLKNEARRILNKHKNKIIIKNIIIASIILAIVAIPSLLVIKARLIRLKH